MRGTYPGAIDMAFWLGGADQGASLDMSMLRRASELGSQEYLVDHVPVKNFQTRDSDKENYKRVGFQQ